MVNATVASTFGSSFHRQFRLIITGRGAVVEQFNVVGHQVLGAEVVLQVLLGLPETGLLLDGPSWGFPPDTVPEDLLSFDR